MEEDRIQQVHEVLKVVANDVDDDGNEILPFRLFLELPLQILWSQFLIRLWKDHGDDDEKSHGGRSKRQGHSGEDEVDGRTFVR